MYWHRWIRTGTSGSAPVPLDPHRYPWIRTGTPGQTTQTNQDAVYQIHLPYDACHRREQESIRHRSRPSKRAPNFPIRTPGAAEPVRTTFAARGACESKCAQLVQDCETFGLIKSVSQMIMEEYRGKLDVNAPARGILASMESFTFLFGIMLGEDFFTIIDHLSRALQKESLSAVEARAYAAVTVSNLMEKRSDDYFERFWDKVACFTTQKKSTKPS